MLLLPSLNLVLCMICSEQTGWLDAGSCRACSHALLVQSLSAMLPAQLSHIRWVKLVFPVCKLPLLPAAEKCRTPDALSMTHKQVR